MKPESIASCNNNSKMIPKSIAINALQSNSARYIYTLSSKPPINSSIVACRLPNTFYLTKEARSDEKIRFTETDMYDLVRTILFTYVFETGPTESILQIINTGEAHVQTIINLKNELDLMIARKLLDELMGENFACIVQRPLAKVYSEYLNSWRFYPFGPKVFLPSALDYLKLNRIFNTTRSDYSEVTQFLFNNSNDHRIHLQGMIKTLA